MDISELIIKDDENRLIQGYASVEIMDRQGDLVPIDAMQKAMVAYSMRGAPLLYGHQNKPVGKVISWNVKEDSVYGVKAVEIVGMINKGYKLEDEVWKMIKEGTITGFSIGGTAVQVATEKTTEGVDARVLKEIELSEISLVVEPANQAAVITAHSMAKSLDPYENLTDEELDKKAQEVVKDVLFELAKNGEIGKKSYPWKKCMDEHHSAKLCGWIKAHYGHKGIGMVDLSEDYIMHEFIIDKDTRRPSTASMEMCKRKAAGVVGDSANDGRLCGYIFYYIMNQSQRKFDEWVLSDEPIPEEWIRMHNIHSYYKYRAKQTIMDAESSRGELPDQTWYNKCVANYEGEASPEKACSYLWYSGYGWGITKENEKLPVVDKEIMEIEKGMPEFDELLKEIVEIQKPFAGMKNWADCMRKIGHGKKKYSKEAKQKICGMLKHKYEKGMDTNNLICPNCGGVNLTELKRETLLVKENTGEVYTTYFDMICKDCSIEFREYTYPHKEPIFFLLEKGDRVKEIECPHCGEPNELETNEKVSEFNGDKEIASFDVYEGDCSNCGEHIKYFYDVKFPEDGSFYDKSTLKKKSKY